MPISSQEQYEKAQALVQSGKAKDPVRLQRSMQRWESFAMPQKSALVEGIGPGTAFDKLQSENPPLQQEAASPKLDAAQQQGYNIDLSQPNVIQNLADDPQRVERIKKYKEATRDESLANASKLKVFNDPPDYEPPKTKLSVSGLLPTALKRHYFYEPTIEEFRSAMTDGNLAKKLQSEFNLVEDVSRLPDSEIENSTTFKAFRDTAWKFALGDAMKEGYALSRLEHSKKMGGLDKFQANALDPAVATARGALRGMTAGLSMPTESNEVRRSIDRNPTAAFAGELVGTITPTGLPSRLATGAAKALGSAGLASKGLQGVAKGLGAGALTGAIDMNLRNIAKFTVDALDAGDTAAEAIERFKETVVKPSLESSLQGANMGVGMSAAGEALGAATGLGARKIVGGTPKQMLIHGQNSGVKMGALGEPVLPRDLEMKVEQAMARQPNPGNADALIAEEIAPKLINRRLVEQEQAAANALNETSAARQKLGEKTVDLRPLAEKVRVYAEEMPGGTPEASAKKTALRRYSRFLRNEGNVSAKRLDDIMAKIDSQANQSAKEPDADWNNVSAMAREARDELTFDDPTKVDNYAIRGPTGETKGISDYSGMKTRQSAEQTAMEVQNSTMGLPAKLKAAPVRLGSAEPDAAAKLIADRPDFPKVQEYFNEHRAVASDVERSDFSRPKDTTRTVDATQAQYAANKAIAEAVDQGLGYRGTTYRGVRMEPEAVQRLIASGEAKADHLWSTAKDEGRALSFAKKQGTGEPVLFSIEGSSGVDLDTVPGLNTFEEVAIPTGKRFRVTDSFRGKDGVLRVKLSDGTSGPDADGVAAMADGAPAVAQVPAKEYRAFKDTLLGTADPKNVVVNDMVVRLAKRTGLDTEKGIRDIQRLRDAQNWKQYLGRAIQGIGSGGGTYIKMNNVLRAVPTLNSVSGGLPKMEASKEAMDVVDRFLEQAVPSWRVLHSRGGQAARPAGAFADKRDRKPRDTLTAEEAEFAAAVIKNLKDMEK